MVGSRPLLCGVRSRVMLVRHSSQCSSAASFARPIRLAAALLLAAFAFSARAHAQIAPSRRGLPPGILVILLVLCSATCSAQQSYQWQAAENFSPYAFLTGTDPVALGNECTGALSAPVHARSGDLRPAAGCNLHGERAADGSGSVW